ncbi:hypothetical protein GW17_00010864 [Ensete ventricosum]|nr:hypothetical protein GW17_00010864 [Ensete ventricosum]
MATDTMGSQPVHLAWRGPTYTIPCPVASSYAFPGGFVSCDTISYDLERHVHDPSSRMGSKCYIGICTPCRLHVNSDLGCLYYPGVVRPLTSK